MEKMKDNKTKKKNKTKKNVNKENALDLKLGAEVRSRARQARLVMAYESRNISEHMGAIMFNEPTNKRSCGDGLMVVVVLVLWGW